MNIFYFDRSPEECAKQHCDKHVVKMIVESAQMLSTAHRVVDGIIDDNIYKSSHINHPCGIWVRQSADHYIYLYQLFESLCKEYTHRYSKSHSSERLCRILKNEPRLIERYGFIEPPQCMPEEYKDETVIAGYRNFYVGAKIDFIRYTNRKAPEWLREYLELYHQTSKIKYER